MMRNSQILKVDKYIFKPLSQSCADRGKGFSKRAHTTCKHDGLDEESEKINNY